MIVVFGSINMDMNLGVKSFPQAGETVISPFYDMSPGGKGANQALAAARIGAKTAIVGKTGDDGMGTRILNSLRRNEVMTSGTSQSEALPTGMAMVMRDSSGDNRVIVASGANSEINAEQVPNEILREGNYVLLQMEVPAEQNINVMERAKEHGAKVILNLAPAIKITKHALELVDYLIVNELEAAQFAEVLGLNAKDDALQIARALSKDGDLTCIVTLGKHGAVAVTQKGDAWKVPPLKIENPLDTTGAGDCFCGTLAAFLHNGMSLAPALKRASIAAGLACRKKGTQSSYPYSADIEEYLDQIDDPEPVS